MDKEEIRKVYNSRPKIIHYVVILVGILLLVGIFYMINGSGEIVGLGLNEEGPPALPGNANSPSVNDNPPALPDGLPLPPGS